MKSIQRRDVLKLGAASAGALLMSLAQSSTRALNARDADRPNILIILFDTFSALHLKSGGYFRDTTPNLDRFAEQAHVYHHHYAPANFTTPGTASILTGMYPWTHRAINNYGLIDPRLAERNIFNLLGGGYFRAAFPQNAWVDGLLDQCDADIDEYLTPSAFSRYSDNLRDSYFFRNDRVAFSRAAKGIAAQRTPLPGLFGLTLIQELNYFLFAQKMNQDLAEQYPRGFPITDFYTAPVAYLNDEVNDGIMQMLDELAQPFLTYIHLLAPHEPYRPRKEFIDAFKGDGFIPAPKPPHPFFSEGLDTNALDAFRREYDEYLLNVDAEFGRLYDHLRRSGILDSSYVIVMSDHGQMFERGYHGHITPMLYESVIRTPLIIHAPKQTQRLDVYDATSNIDLLPTLMTIAGKPIPAWAEGRVLPGFGSQDSARSIFAMDAKTNPAFAPLTRGSFAIIREGLKLIRYQYPDLGIAHELYDLNADADELTDLSQAKPSTLKELAHELDAAIQNANDNLTRG